MHDRQATLASLRCLSSDAKLSLPLYTQASIQSGGSQSTKPFSSMSLIPRWQYMTDESKSLVKRGALSLLVVFVAVIVLRALLPWVLLAVIAWFVWSWVSRR